MYLYSTTDLKMLVKRQNKDVDYNIISEELSNRHYYDKHGFKVAYFSKKQRYVNFLNEDMLSTVVNYIKNVLALKIDVVTLNKYTKNNNFIEVDVVSHEDYKKASISHNTKEEVKNNIQQIKQNKIEGIDETGFIDRSFKNKKIVSIDFEYKKKSLQNVTEIGIAIMKNDEVKYYHYLITERTTSDNQAKSKTKLQQLFNFGKTQYISETEVVDVLKKHLMNCDYLLGKGIQIERQILAMAGIKFKKSKSLELGECHRNFVRLPRNKLPDLKTIAEYYEIPTKHLHNAGNDAAYVMQTFRKMNELINKG